MYALVNPIVALVHNLKLNLWHPIVYAEAPLPGPETPGKLMRHKSVGHHTGGFNTRNQALDAALAVSIRLVWNHTAENCRLALDTDSDLIWNGEDVPADVSFFVYGDDITAKRGYE